jgi:hypothetical protein
VNNKSIIKEHFFRLNPFSKLFCSSSLTMLLIGGKEALVLYSQDVMLSKSRRGM